LDSSGDDQDLCLDAGLPRETQEIGAIPSTQVKIEQDEIDAPLPEDIERVLNRPAVADDVKTGLSTQKARDALAKQGVVIDEKDLNPF